MDSSALVPVVMVRESGGWPCVKVNVKGLFVSAQQPSMRERETTVDRPEYSPGRAAESAAPQNHSPNFVWRALLAV